MIDRKVWSIALTRRVSRLGAICHVLLSVRLVHVNGRYVSEL